MCSLIKKILFFKIETLFLEQMCPNIVEVVKKS